MSVKYHYQIREPCYQCWWLLGPLWDWAALPQLYATASETWVKYLSGVKIVIVIAIASANNEHLQK